MSHPSDDFPGPAPCLINPWLPPKCSPSIIYAEDAPRAAAPGDFLSLIGKASFPVRGPQPRSYP